MFVRLPSSSALKTFESAARLGSFKAAAEELVVTATAVSHQIRALEDQLGVPLFVRKTRMVELTTAGAALAPVLTRAFLDIQKKERMGRTIVIKVKYHDFESITRSQTLPHEPQDAETVFEVARRLLVARTEAGTRPVRLLGLGISGLRDMDAIDTPIQGELF